MRNFVSMVAFASSTAMAGSIQAPGVIAGPDSGAATPNPASTYYNPAALAAAIAARFDCDAACVGNAVRIESASATVLLPRLLEAFEDQVHSISASKATLEDVYVQRTGKAFDAEEPGQ